MKKKIQKKPILSKSQKTYPRPSWVPDSILSEKELCPDCFKVVGERSRYNVVCILGKEQDGLTVTEITKKLSLTQPTISHHLNALQSVDAVTVTKNGTERIFKLNREAHCFEECKIPY